MVDSQKDVLKRHWQNLQTDFRITS